MKLGKLFKKHSYNGKLLILTDRVIWNNIQPPMLTPQTLTDSELIAPNRLLVKVDDSVYMFYYERFRLHGTKLFIGCNP